MPVWRSERPGVEEMRVAVMGCVVNGPGESKHANIGISLPGTFEEPKAPVYVDGGCSSPSRATASSPNSSGSSERLRGVAYRRAPAARGMAEPAVPNCRRAADTLLDLSLHNRPWLAFPLLFGAGLATSLTPCVYPMIPITAGMLGGAGSPGSAGAGRPASLTYALGSRWCTRPWDSWPASPAPFRHGELQPVGLAPHGEPAAGVWSGPVGRLYGERPGPLSGWAAGLAAAPTGAPSCSGATSGLVAAPCAAPAFAAVLTFVAATGSAMLGFAYLLVFSLGMTALLVAVGISSAVLAALPKAGAWTQWISRAAGVLLLAMAEYYFVRTGSVL